MSDDRLTNIPAEAALLGAMLIDNKLVGALSDQVNIGIFADALHGRIFSALMRFHAKGMAANSLTLRPIFQNDSDADYGNYLDTLVDNDVVTVGAASFAAQLVDMAARRAVRDVMHEAMESLAIDLDKPITEIAGPVDEAVWRASSTEVQHPMLDAADMCDIVTDRQDRINSGEQLPSATNILIPDLDDALGGGLELETYSILAGRPGMGKSSVAGSAALGYAINGFPVLELGTEMSDPQRAMRMLADLSAAMGRGIPHADIKKGKLGVVDRQWIERVRARAELLPFKYRKVGACNWRKVYSEVAREKARLKALGKDLWLVIVDYLGMLEADDQEGNPIVDDRKRINAVSKGMMRIRDELGVHVMALAQLARDVDKRPDKRPHNADLKESGNLEQDADIILFAYREEYYLEMEAPKRGEQDNKGRDLYEAWEIDLRAVEGKLDLIVGKNRNDSRRTKTLRFIGKQYAVRGGKFQLHGGIEQELEF